MNGRRRPNQQDLILRKRGNICLDPFCQRLSRFSHTLCIHNLITCVDHFRIQTLRLKSSFRRATSLHVYVSFPFLCQISTKARNILQQLLPSYPAQDFVLIALSSLSQLAVHTLSDIPPQVAIKNSHRIFEPESN